MSTFSVFGNPISHSKSPQIYSIFAKEYGISRIYTRFLAFWINFDQLLKDFFYLGGLGVNITMPFKERAFFLCNKLTRYASIAGSVNTIKKEADGTLFGDNTDGVGLLSDLNRLQWLLNNKKIKILLLGAGGASRGIIFPLLSFGCQIDIVNRTALRAQKLVDYYKHMGKISFFVLETLLASGGRLTGYDIIINALSPTAWINKNKQLLLPIIDKFITPDVACYDLSYKIEKGDTTTPFISLCQLRGARRCSDGLGMLVGQAAHSFLFWHGVFPSINSALRQLRYY